MQIGLRRRTVDECTWIRRFVIMSHFRSGLRAAGAVSLNDGLVLSGDYSLCTMIRRGC